MEHQDKTALYRRITRWMWYLTFGGIAALLLSLLILSFTNLPSVKQLENPRSEEASLAYAANGEAIGRYYTENRVPVAFGELSPHLVAALIATEDERFYEHSGIDFRALARAFVKTILLGQESSGGASTITQQLAKQLFTGKPANSMPRRIIQKLREWIIAVRLERRYTKEEIIAMYFNKFHFTYGGYGVKAASEIYFGLPQDSLSIEQAAVLVGMFKNPNWYNPISRPESALQRRSVVLKQMQKNRLISPVEYDSLRQLPLGVNYRPSSPVEGIAPYFRMELAKDVREILRRPGNRKPDGSSYDIYRDGLRIYTTIDPAMQRLAEEVMVQHMKTVQQAFWDTWRASGESPWEYTTARNDGEVPVPVRQASLERLKRNSARYQALRNQYLLEVLSKIEEEVEGAAFGPGDEEVEHIVADAEQGGVISSLVERNMISREQANTYQQVKRSPHFAELQSQWHALQAEARRAFNTRTKMKVFAYTPALEKDTVMTPMDSIRYHRMFLQTGILAIDPATGQVKVWVGGINFKYFQYGHNRSSRQVGSTFKPFVYATAIAQQGFSPCYQVYDIQQVISPGDGNFGLVQEWKPRNADGRYTGELLTLKEGLRQSKNTVSVYLMKQMGDTEPVRGLIHQMGIDSSARLPNGRYKVPRSPSICLGAADLSNLEMAGAYTTFANNGIYSKPTYLLRIEDKSGRLLYEAFPQERVAINPEANYAMVEMLKYAAAGMEGIRSEVGGKTGTTNDYVDGWFMGITPRLVVGTWVGGDDRWIRFRSLRYGQGAFMARPFFHEFLRRLEASGDIDYDPNARFYRPPGEPGMELDCEEYDKAHPPPGEGGPENEAFNEEFSF